MWKFVERLKILPVCKYPIALTIKDDFDLSFGDLYFIFCNTLSFIIDKLEWKSILKVKIDQIIAEKMQSHPNLSKKSC